MKAMVCEMCNSNDLLKQDGLFVCQSCGTKYTVEEAKKLMGTVTIDRTEELENLFILARRARNDNNYENAEKYYEMITQISPKNWEAAFFQVYYKAMRSTFKESFTAIISIKNCIDSTCILILKNTIQEDQYNAVDTFINHVISIANMFARISKNHRDKYFNIDGVNEECTHLIVASGEILCELECKTKNYFPTMIDKIISIQKAFNQFLFDYGYYYYGTTYSDNSCQFHNDTRKRLNNEILEKDPNYVAPQSKGGCYVATAVYGSYDCAEVWTLRRFRDDTLASTWYGRAFIKTYYTISPTLVKLFGDTQWFKNMWKPTLDKMVRNLNNKGVENTPYNDKQW